MAANNRFSSLWQGQEKFHPRIMFHPSAAARAATAAAPHIIAEEEDEDGGEEHQVHFTEDETAGVSLAAQEVKRLELVKMVSSLEWTASSPTSIWRPPEDCTYKGPLDLEMRDERHKVIMQGNR